MPLSPIIKLFEPLGIPSTEESHRGWTHSRFYLRYRTSGLRATIKLALEQRPPGLNVERCEAALKRSQPEGRLVDLDAFVEGLSDQEARELVEILRQQEAQP